jgi:tetratricopeptide (TPR) repeat protein
LICIVNCALYLRFVLLGLATIILLPGLQSQNTPSLDSLLHAAEILSAEETMELYEEHFLLLANGDLEEGKKLAHKALEIAQESRNGDLEFMARGYMAHAYYLSGDYETAGAQDEWRIEHCLNHGEPGCLGNMLNFGANFLSRFAEYEKGMRYLEDALPDCRAAGDSICVGTNFDHRGNINMRMGKIDEAEKAYQRCLEIRLHVGDTIGLGYVYNNLAWVAAERGNTEDGLKYLSKSLEIREMIGEGYGIATSLANIGETHFMAGNMQEAVSYWKRAMVKAEEIGVMDMKIYILEHIADAYANLGQSQKAIESLKIAHHLKDSILTNEAARASAALEVRYETERQENLISIQQLTIDR